MAVISTLRGALYLTILVKKRNIIYIWRICKTIDLLKKRQIMQMQILLHRSWWDLKPKTRVGRSLALEFNCWVCCRLKRQKLQRLEDALTGYNSKDTLLKIHLAIKIWKLLVIPFRRSHGPKTPWGSIDTVDVWKWDGRTDQVTNRLIREGCRDAFASKKHDLNPNDTGKRYPAFSTLVLRITNCQGLEDNKQIGKPCYWQSYNDIKYWNVLTMVPIATTAWKGKSVLPVFSLCYLWSDRSSLRMVCRFLTFMPV